MKFLRWFWICILMILIPQAHAQSKITRKTPAQQGIIGPEGGTVYSAPDFDAKPLANLVAGYKVTLSVKKYKGRTGLGVFYRIRYDQNKLGYIADTEVIPQYEKGVKKGGQNPEFKEVDAMRTKALSGQEEIILTRYLGALIGQIEYREKFRGQKLTSDVLLYGLRLSGPGFFGLTAPLDISLSFSPKAPDAYQKLTGFPASGILFLSDVSLPLPLWSNFQWLVAGELGLVAKYAKFRVRTGLDYVDSSGFHLGAVAGASVAYRRKKWLGRADVKYYYESQSYLGYWLTLQHEY